MSTHCTLEPVDLTTAVWQRARRSVEKMLPLEQVGNFFSMIFFFFFFFFFFLRLHWIELWQIQETSLSLCEPHIG